LAKKNVVKDVEDNVKTITEPLSEAEVWNVIEFTRAMGNGLYSPYLSPDLVSGRMKDITLNPMAATQAMLDEAMQSPKTHEKQVQEFSQSFELTSMVYKRLLSYLGNMLSFDITYVSNAELEDFSTPKWKKDNSIIEKFIEKFDYKKELHVVVKEMLRNDGFFACFRDTGDRFVLQELPSEYCKITGRWGNGFLFSFDMYWFLQPGVDIDMYPPFFKKKFNEIWGSGASNTATRRYDPSLPPDLRDRSTWIYWVDVPVTTGVCFKLTPELATRLPYFTPLFNDLILQPLMRNLQKSADMASASKMIIGEVPMLNRDAKATVKDSISVSPDLLGKFMALVKSAISDAVRVAAAPLTNMQGVEFTSNSTMYDQYLRTSLASSGINTNLIFSSSIKPNVIETQLSLNVDEQMMTTLYPQFEDFMDYWANKYTKTYKFRFSFEGTDFFLNRDSRLEKQMQLFNIGIVMPQKIAAALGMKPAELRKHMAEGKAMDFMGMLTPPTVLNQEQIIKDTTKSQIQVANKTAELKPEAAPSGKPGVQKAPVLPTTEPASKGRPKKPASKISDEGAKTEAQGTNIGRGGKVR
jgi:hypothetical protein